MGGEKGLTMASKHQYPRHAEAPVGKQIHSIYQDRLRQFTDGGQYYNQGLLPKINPDRASGSGAVKLFVYSPPDLSRPTFKDATSHSFTPTQVGASFGPSWSTHWFRVKLTVPKHLLKYDHLEFVWDASNEGMIWTDEGEVVHGLTGGGERTEWILPKDFKDGKTHTFYVEMACNKMFGNAPGGDSIQPPDPNIYYQLNTAEIRAVNPDARALYFDFWEIGDASREFPAESLEAHRALQVANRIMDTFIAGNGSDKSIKECRKVAQEYLGKHVDSHKVYEGDKNAIVTGIGYCHIDTCWLWPFAETKRKVARSWSNQIDLIERYPELRFCCSQAQQYKWLEQNYPGLFDRVKQKVKEGSFQPIGGSWVEHDTNLPSGESLVRQFLYGQRYFESRFGQRCKTFWLPDTFGYSTQLPQICRLAGMTRFLTQKLSWNNINNFPHTTFNWVALDNSQIICHMPPSETYTAEANFGDVKRSVSQHKSLDQDHTSLLVFGKGDGGGGPTYEHIEKLRRCRGISDQVGLLPRIKLGDSADDFFDRLEKKIENGLDLVTWYGELYFELHRGTYTTQANNKRNNRKSEIMLRAIEYLATLASIQSEYGTKSSYKYPKKDIDDIWENVLLCQFHDCLPGSSIEMCYDDSDKIYEQVFKTGETLLSDALSELGFGDPLDPAYEPSPSVDTAQHVSVNTFSWTRSEIIRMPRPNNDGPPIQRLACGYGPGIMQLHSLDEPNLGKGACVDEIRPNVFQLQNGQYIVEVSNGAITSLYDREKCRELIPEGKKAAQLVLFDDKPLYWQAWDVEVYHLSSRVELEPHSVTINEDGPCIASLTIETRISDKSWAKTTISLPASVGMKLTCIEISTEVHWEETMKFLKVEFPVAITNTSASYETQFGIVKRPTHYNTTWDMAKFEVCCHKWADLSESNYGVSILNDSKYGFAVAGNVMRLSLLRSPKAPDANADMGTHTMRYGLFPHPGPLDHRTVQRALEFNTPLRIHSYLNPNTKRYGTADTRSLLASLRIHNAPNLILDTVKRGEDDVDVSRHDLPSTAERSIIVRMYDSLGGQSRGVMTWGVLPVRKVYKVNVLEDVIEELEIKYLTTGYDRVDLLMEDRIEVEEDWEGECGDKAVCVKVGAFEVVTYKLVLREKRDDY